MDEKELKELEKVRKRASKCDWKWEGLKVTAEEDEDGKPYTHVYVPECSYLGGTGVMMSNNSYENYGDDCLYVQSACRAVPKLIAEIRKLRRQLANAASRD